MRLVAIAFSLCLFSSIGVSAENTQLKTISTKQVCNQLASFDIDSKPGLNSMFVCRPGSRDPRCPPICYPGSPDPRCPVKIATSLNEFTS